jgi:DNA processing protein
VVSGYAKGVDTESHLASLGAGGGTIAVLAEGIAHFRLKKPYRELPTSAHDQLLVISQFPPSQGWTVGAAMTRNRVIVGLCPAVVVVEAGETGGTLKAGELAIQLDRRLLVLGFADGDPDGNKKLIAAGGRRVSSRTELVAELARLRGSDGDSGNQLTLV